MSQLFNVCSNETGLLVKQVTLEELKDMMDEASSPEEFAKLYSVDPVEYLDGSVPQPTMTAMEWIRSQA